MSLEVFTQDKKGVWRIAQRDPEDMLEQARAFVAEYYPSHADKTEEVWSVVHHEASTVLHLDVFWRGLSNRRARYRHCGLIHTPVRALEDNVYPSDHGRARGVCKECTKFWRDLNGYGVEDDIDQLDDLPFYHPKGTL